MEIKSDYKTLSSLYTTDIQPISGATLINAGLPWTNPLKLQIGSDEHIIDTTINRGLMMLLNNDYYLDMKNDILSKELSSVISNEEIIATMLNSHIHDEEMHQGVKTTIQTSAQGSTYSFTINGLNNDDKYTLTKDTVRYLPITYNAEQLQKIIDNVPKNLNGHTIIFLFVVPEWYEYESEYSLNLMNSSVSFNNFSNGTVIIMGDYLHDSNAFKKFTLKTKEQIEDPEKKDDFNVKKFIASFEEEFDNPEPIDEIISYESGNEKYDLEKIIIKGTALNKEYSLLSFNQNTANIYVKNLKFVSSIETDIPEIVIDKLPTEETQLLFYSLEDDAKPGNINSEFINNTTMENIYPLFNDDVMQIISGENVTNNYNISYLINDVNEVISSSPYYLSSEINDLMECVSSEETKSIISAATSLGTAETLIEVLSDSLNVINIEMQEVAYNHPKTELESYLDEEDNFLSGKFVNDIEEYANNVNAFHDNLVSFFNSNNFKQLLKYRPDLATSDFTKSYSEDELLSLYKTKYLNNVLISLTTSILNISNYILNNLSTLSVSSISGLILKKSNDGVIFENVKKNSYEKNITFGNDFKSCTALYLNESEENSHIGYVYLDNSKYTNNLFKRLFNENSSICFWTKPNTDKINITDIGYFGFRIKKNSDLCNLVINAEGITCIMDNNVENSISFENVNQIYNAFKDSWLFWEVKIYADKLESDHMIGFECGIYAYALTSEGKYAPKLYKLKPTKSDSYVAYIKYPFDLHDDYFRIDIGHGRIRKSEGFRSYFHNGYLRNVSLWNRHMTEIEAMSLFKSGIVQMYSLPSQYERDNMNEIIKNGKFFIGFIGSYNNFSINILNCIMKYKQKYSI